MVVALVPASRPLAAEFMNAMMSSSLVNLKSEPMRAKKLLKMFLILPASVGYFRMMGSSSALTREVVMMAASSVMNSSSLVLSPSYCLTKTSRSPTTLSAIS